jgi:hypothetical protein
VVATNIDIWRMIKRGYKVTLVKALIYPNTFKVFERYINKINEMKEECESARVVNMVLRNLLKLLMNGLYGKTLEKPVNLTHKLINFRSQFDEFCATHYWNDVHIFDNDKKTALMEGIPKEKNKSLKKPYQLGPCVLGWSR